MKPFGFLWYFFIMDESNPPATHEQPPSLRSHSTAVMRALASAAIFGTMGWMMGRGLGKRANPDNSTVAESIMKWGMGFFSATLAAYSSLKVSEQDNASRHDKETLIASDKVAPDAGDQSVVGAAHTKSPSTYIEVPESKLDGNIVENSALQRL